MLLLPNLTPSIAETGTSISIPVTLSNPSRSAVDINWSISDGSATAGNDFVTPQSLTLQYAASTQTMSNTSESITINITDDTDYEGDETFTVTLNSATNANIPGDSGTIEISVTITENEAKPTGLKFTGATSSVAEDVSGNKTSIPNKY